MSGEPCVQETLAIFPSEDVGGKICEIAKPAIASAIRDKAPERVSVTFSCSGSADQSVPGYEPRRRDNRITMVDPGKVSPIDAVMGIIDKLAK
jgi:hypothetical protein